jgi:uncharacterized membrane protein YjgN (DUF898 family)
MNITSDDPESPWRPASGPSPATAMPHALPITFQGSGSEYFRIWAVNLLLTLVTLGLYYPWAKARRLRYFYGNTFIGEHALDFHGDPKLMLRGFLVAVAMVVAYSIAGKVSVLAGVLAFFAVAAAWPALFLASQRFRLANTSWRGLRFRFDGRLAGAYLAVLPLFLPALVMLAPTLLDGMTRNPGALQILLLAISVLLVPYGFWRLKRYQHGHFNFGQIRTELRTGPGSFYLLALKLFAVALSLPVAAALWLEVVGGAQQRGLGLVVFVFLGFLAYGVAFAVGQPYLVSRSQNLVWGRTGSDELHFESALRFWPLFGLTLKNMLLIVFTLGLYAPFARVATTRMRLQALSVQSALDPDQLFARLDDGARRGAAGDAAGDLLGFDIGW